MRNITIIKIMALSIRWMDIVLGVLFLLTIAFYFIRKHYKFFKNLGIKNPPTIPIIGNIYELVTFRIHLSDLVMKYYKQFDGEKYFGFFYGFKPIIVLRDVELVKQICIKDFDHFIDHINVVEESDAIFYHSLFSLNGEKWRNMRNTLTPAFTGSKMRQMMHLVEECSGRFMEFMRSKSNEGIVYEIDIKDMLSRYTTDVIASCAFGIECDSLNKPENEFYQKSHELTKIGGKASIIGQVLQLNPILRKLMKISLAKQEVQTFYKNIVMGMIKQRSETGVVRKDMIHLLMLAISGKLSEEAEKTNKLYEDVGFATVHEDVVSKKAEKKSWSDYEITAQAVIFLFAGKDTTSNMLTFLCYALAMNPEIQKKLREEVDEYIRDNNCMIKYDDIRNLKYMDMVVSETLRLWPPAGTLDRICVKSYTLPPPREGGKEVKIEKDQIVYIPAYSIHRDPKYFPDPEKFNPERFSDENKSNIDLTTYLPFGIGPRSCIGNRFALMEAKVVMFYIMANFEIQKTSKTITSLEIEPHIFTMMPIENIILGFKKRKNVLKISD